MSWFASDEEVQIPADILARLESRVGVGCFDEPERSSVERMVDIYQKIRWRNIQLETELIAAQTNMGYMREQIEDLVSRLRKTGNEPRR
ncbi:hypothetical protein WG29040_23270 [Pseudomonas sp. PAMC 29040]|uniref:hypothetical protein n=1 Tax=Pseudomonas sp. PAMC 29040 TaxID=2498450 RepID=UPI000F973879|nr:hypothetical protein [Pseudomonas sp. PAMC 29040]RUT30862.1 hypothetical protein WG29040_23270 [Pseudomonas sp. PAMC 29040]